MKLTIEQRNLLILDHLDLAKKYAIDKHRQIRFVDVDELISAAYSGLVDAASRYEPDRGVFSSFVIPRIVGEIQDYLRSLGFGSKKSRKMFVLLDD